MSSSAGSSWLGAEQLPADGPVVVVANHTNGLVDGLLLIARLGRYPRFLGKSTLFRILPLKPFLRLAGVVPVYRAADGEGTGRNDQTFARCRELLSRGGVIAIFPEGISHDEAALQPLRSGAAAHRARRRVRRARATRDRGADRSGLRRQGSLPITRAHQSGLADPRRRVRHRLRRRSARRGARADRPGASRPDRRRTRVGRSARAATSPTGSVAWSIVAIVLLAPIALVGAIVHAVPYQIMKRVARLPDNESIKSTVKLLGCAVLFFVEWVVLARGRRLRLERRRRARRAGRMPSLGLRHRLVGRARPGPPQRIDRIGGLDPRACSTSRRPTSC